jgi:hypothetical protein
MGVAQAGRLDHLEATMAPADCDHRSCIGTCRYYVLFWRWATAEHPARIEALRERCYAAHDAWIGAGPDLTVDESHPAFQAYARDCDALFADWEADVRRGRGEMTPGDRALVLREFIRRRVH